MRTCIQLRNIEDGTVILYYENHGSPWINKMEDAEKWLREQESKRFDQDKVKRPSTRWVFEAFFSVDVNVVLDRQPLVGTGPLPEGLRKLAHSRRCSRWILSTITCACGVASLYMEAFVQTEAPKGFLNLAGRTKTSMNELEKVEKYLNAGAPASEWLGFQVYIPERLEDEAVVWHLFHRAPARMKRITIGVYEGHAFLIKNIEKLAKK